MKYFIGLSMTLLVTSSLIATPTCIQRDPYTSLVDQPLLLPDESLNFCVYEGCWRFTENQYRFLGKPSEQPYPVRYPAVTIADDGKFHLCTGPDRCHDSRLRLSSEDGQVESVAVSDDLKLLAIVHERKNGRLLIGRNVQNGKVLFQVNLDPDFCHSVSFADSTILHDQNNCAGPDNQLEMIDGNSGQRLGWIGDGVPEYGGMFSVTPVALGNDIWAFNDTYGFAILFYNVKTGKHSGTIDLRNELPRGEDGEAAANAPGATSMFRIRDGNLVVLFSAPIAGDVLYVDPDRRVITRHHSPALCSAK